MDKIQSNTPKKQHYVPQFLLKKFSYGKKHKLFAFNKTKAISFGASVADSACENGFYNIEINGHPHTLEHKLSKLETICGSVINKICKDESLERITEDDRMVLCVFVANMLIRVKKQRYFLQKLNTDLSEFIQKMGLNPNEVINFEVLDKEDINKQHVHFTHENGLKFADDFFKKPIALLKAPNGSSFLISDNPVVMHNYWPKKTIFRGDKGVSVPGVEIQIPISNKLCISFICPLLLADIKEKVDFLSIHKGIDPLLDKIDISYAEALLASINERKAIELKAEHVKFSNSLQISDALEYIYSEKNDFRLAEDMIRKATQKII